MTGRDRKPRTAVIGGGMAGCAAAKQLIKAGHEVVVYESADGLGGRARSWHRPEIEPSVGINLMYVSFYSLMTEMLEEYGLKDDVIPISGTLWVSHGGKVAPLDPSNLMTLAKYPHVSVRDRVRFFLSTLAQVRRKEKLDMFDPVKAAEHDDGDSAADWGYRQLSRRGFDYLMRPQVEGFWNFACEEVSAVHARSLLAWMGGSGFYVLPNGIQVIAEKNAAGAELRLSHEVTGIHTEGGREGGVRITAAGPDKDPVTDSFDGVVVATPAPAAAKLVADLPATTVSDGMRSYLETQRYEPAISVSFLAEPGTVRPEAHILAGGPDDPPLRNMITYPRKVRDEQGNLVDKVLVFAYPGRAITRRLLGRPPEEQFAEVAPLLSTLWPGFPVESAEPFHIAERPLAFPIPAPGRYRLSAGLVEEQRSPVVFAGDYFNSPTTEAAMLSGTRAAEALTKAG
ncbi:FAD-dependent oxidoreductase [Streptomyces sp. LHD-70]|uniref:FAD-dependent oxidoreductase n=1 Tax=Streptomyces sp. LHD-70 TaxID=3072140 RepID=UPI00281069AB|nr:FAD-dependent oxidoreductase [Streptomyces sp. LHD-70]MDQ8706186.1 FAD-dependent oxidoreductase [Streptomyces sp. LHD-70]